METKKKISQEFTIYLDKWGEFAWSENISGWVGRNSVCGGGRTGFVEWTRVAKMLPTIDTKLRIFRTDRVPILVASPLREPFATGCV